MMMFHGCSSDFPVFLFIFMCLANSTSFMILLFSQYLRNVKVPCFLVTPARKCKKVSYPLFSLFPVSFVRSRVTVIP